MADRLAAGGRVAGIGCGHGVAAILLACAYPQASVHGYDFHERSIQVARQRAGQAGLDGRIRFEPLDATSYPADGFDLICLLDTLHDLGDPAAVLAHARKALAPGGGRVPHLIHGQLCRNAECPAGHRLGKGLYPRPRSDNGPVMPGTVRPPPHA